MPVSVAKSRIRSRAPSEEEEDNRDPRQIGMYPWKLILLFLLVCYSVSVAYKKHSEIEKQSAEMQQRWNQCLEEFVGGMCRVKSNKEDLGEEKCTSSLQCIKMGSSLSLAEVMVETIKETLEEVSKVGIPILLILILVRQLR